MALVDGELINDGMGIIRYLDRTLAEVDAAGKVATGIVIGTVMRTALTEACQKTLGMAPKKTETVNRYHNVLLIEDGNHVDRLEVISGKNPVLPVENTRIFSRGFRRA